MKTIGFAAVAAFAVLALSVQAPAQEGNTATAKQKIDSVNYLVGTWQCQHTVGDFKGKYKTTFSKTLGGLWLKQTYDFPPGQAGEKTSAQTAEALMGYSDDKKAWVRFFANSLGQYFAIRMTETDTGWSWKYVSFFATRLIPLDASPDATLTKKSNREFVIDGPTYPKDGTQVTEHHVCEKL